MSRLSLFCITMLWLCYTGYVSADCADCGDPPTIMYGSFVTMEHPSHGKGKGQGNKWKCRAEYECIAGYELHGAFVMNCHPKDKGWGGNPPSCEPACGDGALVTGEECDITVPLTTGCYPPGHELECTYWDCGDGYHTTDEVCDESAGHAMCYEEGHDLECEMWSCGDGYTTDGEECDDGDSDNTNDCLDTCVDATCGDGYKHATGEDCDDDDAAAFGALNSPCCDACVLTTSCCGDAILDAAEVCDDGTDGAVGGNDDTSCNGISCLLNP